MSKKCINCGNLSNDSAQFCEKCGSSGFSEPISQQQTTGYEGGPVLNNVTSTQSVDGSNNEQMKKSKNKTAIIAGLSVLLLGLVALIVFLLISDKGETNEAKDDNNATTTSVSSTKSPDKNVNEGINTDKQPGSTTVTMSDDLYDYTFKLDGVVYQLPCDYKDFTDNGWTISDVGIDINGVLNGNEYISCFLTKNDSNVTLYFYNLSGNSKPLLDCKIGGISYDSYDDFDFEIAKNITVNSTLDEVKTAFGEPGQSSLGGDFSKLYYYENDDTNNNYVKFSFSNEMEYNSIDIMNFVEMEDDKTNTSTETPDYLSEYVVPTSMGSDFKSAIVKVDGDLYQLPAPVSAFTDNGWVITYKPGNIVAGDSEYITVERNGKEMGLYINNFADYQTIPENCAVYSVHVYDYQNVDVLVGSETKYITFGNTKSEVDSFSNGEFDYYNGTISYSYTYYEDKNRNFTVKIDVDKTTEKVSIINVSCKTWDY